MSAQVMACGSGIRILRPARHLKGSATHHRHYSGRTGSLVHPMAPPLFFLNGSIISNWFSSFPPFWKLCLAASLFINSLGTWRFEQKLPSF